MWGHLGHAPFSKSVAWLTQSRRSLCPLWLVVLRRQAEDKHDLSEEFPAADDVEGAGPG